ncbi:MAG: hypothetical protein IKR85_02260 [Clostridia bacterium]|nr:hypothetical protein [Clostridia bacterium]
MNALDIVLAVCVCAALIGAVYSLRRKRACGKCISCPYCDKCERKKRA